MSKDYSGQQKSQGSNIKFGKKPKINYHSNVNQSQSSRNSLINQYDSRKEESVVSGQVIEQIETMAGEDPSEQDNGTEFGGESEMFDSELGHRNTQFTEPQRKIEAHDFEEITSEGLKSPGRSGNEFFKNSPNIPRPKGSNPSLKQKPIYHDSIDENHGLKYSVD